MVEGFSGRGFGALGIYKGSTKDSKEDVCFYVTKEEYSIPPRVCVRTATTVLVI